jgi:ABC-type polysaccharide/polyol phosphate transport system ATPase subunit
MNIVKEMADRVIVLKKGEKVFDGDVADGIKYYNELMN